MTASLLLFLRDSLSDKVTPPKKLSGSVKMIATQWQSVDTPQREEERKNVARLNNTHNLGMDPVIFLVCSEGFCSVSVSQGAHLSRTCRGSQGCRRRLIGLGSTWSSPWTRSHRSFQAAETKKSAFTSSRLCSNSWFTAITGDSLCLATTVWFFYVETSSCGPLLTLNCVKIKTIRSQLIKIRTKKNKIIDLKRCWQWTDRIRSSIHLCHLCLESLFGMSEPLGIWVQLVFIFRWAGSSSTWTLLLKGLWAWTRR